jgi:hypothetical protein
MKFFWMHRHDILTDQLWIASRVGADKYKFWCFKEERNLDSDNRWPELNGMRELKYMRTYFESIKKDGKPIFLSVRDEKELLKFIATSNSITLKDFGL